MKKFRVINTGQEIYELLTSLRNGNKGIKQVVANLVEKNKRDARKPLSKRKGEYIATPKTLEVSQSTRFPSSM